MGKRGSTFAGADRLPPSRVVDVRSTDGTRLHTEVFGPESGYPIVLVHGFTCAIRVWAEQIRALSTDYRVIAFDQRGHGRSDIPHEWKYTLSYLADDLDAVLNATLAPGERAVIAGHSMGGVTVGAWSSCLPERVPLRADAVALINTTTGDMLRDIDLLQVPWPLASPRVQAAGKLLRKFGGVPRIWVADPAIRRLVSMMAVGDDADPAITEFVFDLFIGTPKGGRGGCARMLVEALGARHIELDGLTVPTLVIGSVDDRLTPIGASRRIAASVPELVSLVELSGGHCAILEHGHEINRRLRMLTESVTLRQATS